MALSDYTTFADVRAALSVSDDELEDATLGLALFEDNLLVELSDIHADLTTQFATVSAIAEASQTAAQKHFLRVTRLFSTYSVANQVCTSLGLLAPKDIGDGKALSSRFADSPYRDTKKDVREKYDLYRLKLAEAFAGLSASTATVTSRSYMRASGLSTDPVTGS